MKYLTVSIFFIFFFFSFLQRHVYNYDFWWHLATGKYIVENKSLPQDDPFSYTSHETPTKRKSTILKGYWLAEVIFYKVYNLWDLRGIIILRSILMLMAFFWVFLTAKKQGSSDLLAIILVLGVFIFSKNTLGERPQLFTFLSFSLILFLLEDFRVNKSKKIFLIPIIILSLSNMHPGYIVCILLISIYLIGECILFLFKKKSGGSFKILFAIWILTAIFSLWNPNGFGAFREFLSAGKHIEGIVEFKPTFSVYASKIVPLDYSYLIFLAFSLFGLRYLRKIGIVHMALLSVFTLMSFIAIRYVIFYMFVSAPILAKIIINIKEERIVKKYFKLFKVREGFLYMITTIIGIFFVVNSIPALARYEFKADTTFAAPKDASDFLIDLKISGNMFNEYGFGGYLIWRLYPEKKVFIDGRSLEPDVYEEYKFIASASVMGKRSWEDILKSYNISYIVTPPLLPGGEIYPIVDKLFDSEDWVLIYSDQLSLIFLRNDPENISIIKKFAKDKIGGLNTIIIQASARATLNKTNPHYLITLGKTFFKMGRFADAEKAFEMAYQRDPNNIAIKEWLKKIREKNANKL